MLLELLLAGFWCGSQLRERLKHSKMIVLFAEVSEVVVRVLLVDGCKHMIIMMKYGVRSMKDQLSTKTNIVK